MDKKGFAISGILYTVLVIFLTSMVIILFNLQNRKTILDELKVEAVEAVEEDNNYEALLEKVQTLETKVDDLSENSKFVELGSIADTANGTITLKDDLNNYKNVMLVGVFNNQLVGSEIYPVSSFLNYSSNGIGVYFSTYNGVSVYAATLKALSGTKISLIASNYYSVYVLGSK